MLTFLLRYAKLQIDENFLCINKQAAFPTIQF